MSSNGNVRPLGIAAPLTGDALRTGTDGRGGWIGSATAQLRTADKPKDTQPDHLLAADTFRANLPRITLCLCKRMPQGCDTRFQEALAKSRRQSTVRSDRAVVF